ncbi:Hypothetical protein NCS54_00423100 [Fusarium falciforme]|uniref:Hypothetical protein n=1 Tax=Fusarium falciforme TaxID=195108 RepID=UPI0022FFC6A4|nr:Hypothetical protein NCS54_00423100 [Fusarium falciforme]WAO86940.1 Hypothetical protein NCS54_00423100 [Fusarium falciforme]
MESESPATAGGATPVRKRISTACEACRVTKIKCQPSEQPGVCRKCLESKKECISRTGPRTRRRRTKFVFDGHQSQPQPPPPPAPSKTFTIDFDVPSLPEVDENFDALRDSHSQMIDSIFPSDQESDALSAPDSPPTGFPTPGSSNITHSIQSLHAKPQFNLDSAASLLASFRGMLVHYPVVSLKPEETVSSLAASRPFVLLAILSAASGSRTLQGHTLYDEEFRKVLGLKFVAGGERSMELLQGILIYCAWYPFHLRPKNKQAFQYYRMAGDLVHDLDLEEENPELITTPPGAMTASQLDRLRAYLGYYYAVSKYVLGHPHTRPLVAYHPSYMTAWKRMDQLACPWTPWTATCCDVLQRCAEADGDLALSYLARLASSTNTANKSIRDNNTQSAQQVQLLLLGLEAQHRELKEAMLPHIARSAPVRLADLFFNVFLQGGAVFYLTRKIAPSGFVHPPASRLRSCVTNLRALFDYLTDLGQSGFMSFTSVDWTKFILSVILAVRLSFPMSEVKDWDHAWAREELRFEAFLETMCDGADLTPVSTRVDVLSAGRVVLRVLKEKYDRRVAMLNMTASHGKGLGPQGCPMFDRSMEPYISAWDTGFDMSSVMPPLPPQQQSQQEGQQAVFHDLWATMTMGWANDSLMDDQDI